MYKENPEVLKGNDQFEGYNIDLIDAISKILRKTAAMVVFQLKSSNSFAFV